MDGDGKSYRRRRRSVQIAEKKQGILFLWETENVSIDKRVRGR